MVTPRYTKMNTHSKQFHFIIIISAVVIVFLCVSASNSTSHYSMEKAPVLVSSRNSNQEMTRTRNAYIQDTVSLKLPNGEASNKNILDYIHCGSYFRSDTMDTDNDLEILMLHGAAFKKEDWVTSGILNDFCFKGGKHISVTAIDLSVRVGVEGLEDAFQALVGAGVLSGLPVIIISPSASGKSVVNLASDGYKSDNGMSILQKLLKTWIPVATSAVLSVKEKEVFSVFPNAGIDILAIHGDLDEMGKKVTQTLENYAGAKGVQLHGRHPCYLDSPTQFVQTIYDYLRGEDVS